MMCAAQPVHTASLTRECIEKGGSILKTKSKRKAVMQRQRIYGFIMLALFILWCLVEQDVGGAIVFLLLPSLLFLFSRKIILWRK